MLNTSQCVIPWSMLASVEPTKIPSAGQYSGKGEERMVLPQDDCKRLRSAWTIALIGIRDIGGMTEHS